MHDLVWNSKRQLHGRECCVWTTASSRQCIIAGLDAPRWVRRQLEQCNRYLNAGGMPQIQQKRHHEFRFSSNPTKACQENPPGHTIEFRRCMGVLGTGSDTAFCRTGSFPGEDSRCSGILQGGNAARFPACLVLEPDFHQTLSLLLCAKPDTLRLFFILTLSCLTL